MITWGMSATAQTKTFTTDDLDYALDLPSASWRPVSRLDVHQHMEFVNGDDYSDGYLRLRKRLVAAGTIADELFRYDEKWELQRLSGYVVCSNGNGNGAGLDGHLRARVFSYEYIDGGMNMDGRIYYLKLDNRTYYVLHFTIASGKLQGFRNQMDSIARSFRMK
jgi:hypothetical protein